MKRIVLVAMLGLSLSPMTSRAQAQDIVDTAVKAGSFKTLVAAVQAAGLVDTLKGSGPFTVFAPTDEAFAKLPPGTVETLLKPENRGQLVSILTYHVVPARVTARDAFSAKSAPTVNGQKISVNATLTGIQVDGAKVLTADISCTNGVIHVIDSVILPSSANIPETASGAGTFNTLLAAAKAAGLVDALSSKGPLTVFAPTDAAFAALPAGTVESLLKPENKEKLAGILKYHVVSGNVLASDAIKAGQATTLQGQPVTISYGADGVKINDAKVVTADIKTTNGVIHVIDAVMLPKTMSPQAAQEMIRGAIADGSHRFNSHDHAGCCHVYSQALEKIMSSRPASISETEATHLNHTMHASLQLTNMTERAWKLRETVESAYAALSSH